MDGGTSNCLPSDRISSPGSAIDLILGLYLKNLASPFFPILMIGLGGNSFNISLECESLSTTIMPEAFPVVRPMLSSLIACNLSQASISFCVGLVWQYFCQLVPIAGFLPIF